ncbi:golgin candidate 1-like isoform X2 [Chenopodium quinoa]|uniref:golgin candidate 1-like isoform X2 n=1 Tax=Chenopodium quinoa TaxID=63459 RepID=UPI000B796472|nr:golgin candidate 1-like isoform X2 [Chenopodium quinoa]
MAEALAAKNSEIKTLVSSVEALKKQAALSEGNLASLQENMETLMRNRELTETRMMQALKEELALAERRAEEECAAHNANKKAAMEREVKLEHRAVDASTGLARLQVLKQLNMPQLQVSLSDENGDLEKIRKL